MPAAAGESRELPGTHAARATRQHGGRKYYLIHKHGLVIYKNHTGGFFIFIFGVEVGYG